MDQTGETTSVLHHGEIDIKSIVKKKNKKRGGDAEPGYNFSNNPRRAIMDANGITWPTIIQKPKHHLAFCVRRTDVLIIIPQSLLRARK